MTSDYSKRVARQPSMERPERNAAVYSKRENGASDGLFEIGLGEQDMGEISQRSLFKGEKAQRSRRAQRKLRKCRSSSLLKGSSENRLGVAKAKKKVDRIRRSCTKRRGKKAFGGNGQPYIGKLH